MDGYCGILVMFIQRVGSKNSLVVKKILQTETYTISNNNYILKQKDKIVDLKIRMLLCSFGAVYIPKYNLGTRED